MQSKNDTRYLGFKLTRIFNYEFRIPVSKSEIQNIKGAVRSWGEMVAVLDGIKPLQNYNVPIIGTVESAVGLQNIYTGVLRQISLAEFNTSKSDVKLDPRLDFFVCRGDRPVPTVRDIKEFIGGCSDCGFCDFCKNKLDLKDDAPAYFDMSCSPCIRPLSTAKDPQKIKKDSKNKYMDVVYYIGRSLYVDSRLLNFFTAPMNLKIVSPSIIVNNQKERE